MPPYLERPHTQTCKMFIVFHDQSKPREFQEDFLPINGCMPKERLDDLDIPQGTQVMAKNRQKVTNTGGHSDLQTYLAKRLVKGNC